MTKLHDLPNILDTASEETAAPRVKPKDTTGLVAAQCRVFGKTPIPVMVDLESRSVFPTKAE